MVKRDNTKNLQLNKPGLFTPTVIRGLRQGADAQTVTFGGQTNELVASNISSTSSFKYSINGDGLRSTQQLNVDFGNFASHTFFNSAQVKTNVAFDKIFNEFPFDGTKQEFEAFFESLIGFEKYVYDQMPKHTGYLFFSGTKEPETTGGTYVTVKDIAGSSFPSISRLRTGKTILNPGSAPMTLEMQLFLPKGANTGSVILDKHVEPSTGTRDGFYLALETTEPTESGSVSLYILSGTVYDKTSIEIQKGVFNHIAYVWDRTPGVETVAGYVNQTLFTSSSQPIEFQFIDASTADLLIGSGSALTGLFTPTTTFSGAIDELRIWHSIRSADERTLYKEKAVFADDDLKLYYKFNEPPGSNSPLIIDHSKNSLHGRLNMGGQMLGVREEPANLTVGPSPMIFEKIKDAPVLFPTHPGVLDLQSELLSSASIYDRSNPNIITRLIPVHYFLEGQSQDALDSEQGDIVNDLQGGVDPRTVNLGATQTFLLLLYTWAKFFDEMKLYLQTMSTLIAVDYDDEDTIPDQFLSFLARNEGIDLPPLFEGSSIEQYIEAENIQSDISTNDISLQSIQNQIWRRVLINLQDVVKSKGTIHAVKSFIRSVGVDPDNNFRIREFGGPTRRPLTYVREKRSEISTMVDFVSGGLIQSPFLSASRTEPGFPLATGNTSNIVGQEIEIDSYLTSGSWTYEGHYKFVPKAAQTISQSLVRFFVSGTIAPSFSPFSAYSVANLVHVKGGNTTLYVRANPEVDSPVLEMPITGADLFNGETWYVSFGRQRADEIDSTVSASYFLRLANQEFGEISEQYTTQSYFDEGATGGILGTDQIVWSSLAEFVSSSAPTNVFGAAFVIGSQSLDINGEEIYLNTTSSLVDPTARVTDFFGRVGHMRFWSKALSEKEWPEHVRYFRSVGVQDPLTNFNFTTTPTGSWERLRIDASSDQPVTKSDSSGFLHLTDFTQNNFTLTASAFPANQSIITPERFFFSYLSPKFDEAATTEKVRIRSFLEFENVQQVPWAQVGPSSDIERSELPTDNTRFTVDFSVVDALNQDIITIFSTLESLDNTIGNPDLLFSPDYPRLEDLRDVYFNKLTDKMNLRLFFEFFKWFDTNIGTFIGQLLPRKTKFLGTNFVIESHMLERPKVEYLFSDIYLGDNNRHSLKDTILLRLFTGVMNKY